MNHEVDENMNKTAHGQICKLYANRYVNSSVSTLLIMWHALAWIEFNDYKRRVEQLPQTEIAYVTRDNSFEINVLWTYGVKSLNLSLGINIGD